MALVVGKQKLLKETWINRQLANYFGQPNTGQKKAIAFLSTPKELKNKDVAEQNFSKFTEIVSRQKT